MWTKLLIGVNVNEAKLLSGQNVFEMILSAGSTHPRIYHALMLLLQDWDLAQAVAYVTDIFLLFPALRVSFLGLHSFKCLVFALGTVSIGVRECGSCGEYVWKLS